MPRVTPQLSSRPRPEMDSSRKGQRALPPSPRSFLLSISRSGFPCGGGRRQVGRYTRGTKPKNSTEPEAVTVRKCAEMQLFIVLACDTSSFEAVELRNKPTEAQFWASEPGCQLETLPRLRSV